jgi:hypothetical protein
MTTAMSDLKPGDTVTVKFDGEEHPGTIEKIESNGWLRCLIRQDPDNDYTGIEPPHTTLKTQAIDFTVSVREKHVRRQGQ